MRNTAAAGFALALGMAAECRAQAPQAQPQAAPPAVDEVTVTATAPPKQTRIDRTVYAVSRDLQATTGTAADILADVPSVAVDADGNVSLRGDANVTILVDGKPSAEFAGATRGLALQQFPANEIDHIEVLTTPPAQYKAEGSGGVINIVTKKRSTAAGPSGSLQGMLGDKRRYVFGADGAANVGPFKVSGAVGLRRDAKERITDGSRLTQDPVLGPQASAEHIDEQFRRFIPSVKAGIDYTMSPSTTLSASYSHRELTGDRYFDQSDQGGPLGQPVNSSTFRHSDGHEWAIDASEGLRLDQTLGRPGETLSLGVQRSATGERERYFYTDTAILPPGPPAHPDLHLGLDLVKTEANADYARPLGKDASLKLGYDFEDDRNGFNNFGHMTDPATGQAVLDPNVTNDFLYRQQVHALYGQYEGPVGDWRLQAGLRVEAAHVSFLQITGDIPGGRNDLGAYPSLHLERPLYGGNLSFNLSRRITRPDPEALNPFADHQDIHNLRAGNPDLLPQDTWTYEAAYNGRLAGVNYGTTAYYRFDRNSVTDVIRPVSDDVVIATKTNLPKSQWAGLEFSANGKLGSRLSYSLSGDAFYAQIDATGIGGTGLASTVGVNLKASLDFKATAADTAQVSLSRADRRLTAQGSIAPINLVNLGYKHQLRPDLALVLTVTDLLDGQRQERIVNTPVLQDDYVRHQLGRVALVGFTYTFGASKKAKGGGFQYDQ